MKKLLNVIKTRLINFLRKIVKKLLNMRIAFNYKDYWQLRYLKGEGSGAGSYSVLAEFKAEVINNFIKDHNIKSVIEFGCGDGSQLKLMNCAHYLGFDIAKASIKWCRLLFRDDKTKSFMIYDPKYFINNDFIRSDLVVCLDVLYHIIPEEEFIKTLQDIFSCSSKYVILYTSIDAYKYYPYKPGSHIYHRDTLRYLSQFKEFKIEKIIEQKYKNLSSADFIIMVKNHL